MDYLRDHWRGRHPLPRAFWINFLLPFVLIAMAEPWIRPGVAGASVMQGVAAAVYILVTHAVILPWQIVGLWRSSRRHLHERGDLMTVTFAQLAILVALVTAVGANTTTVQRIFGLGQRAQESPSIAPRYVLQVLQEGRIVAIDGPFDTGLSRDFNSLLAETPDIEPIGLPQRQLLFGGVHHHLVETGQQGRLRQDR